MKVIVTGGSGFIGTNLISRLEREDVELINIDFAEPRNKKQISLWRNVDITDSEALEEAVVGFRPDYIVHLAARTDIKGNTINDYKANTIGVKNILQCCHKMPDLKKVLFTSSMLVSRVGYKMKSIFDYNPPNAYGESKVETEHIILGDPPSCDWDILRPTSIWGPWFDTYRDFFEMVMKGRYFHFGKKSSTKTYGYVGNVAYQIEQLLFADTSAREVAQRVFYLGDEPAYYIEDWANEIAELVDKKVPRIPYWIIKTAALCGDVLKTVNIDFPMTSFRLKNMTTDNIVDLKPIMELAPNAPFTRKEGSMNAIEWIKEQQK